MLHLHLNGANVMIDAGQPDHSSDSCNANLIVLKRLCWRLLQTVSPRSPCCLKQATVLSPAFESATFVQIRPALVFAQGSEHVQSASLLLHEQ